MNICSYVGVVYILPGEEESRMCVYNINDIAFHGSIDKLLQVVSSLDDRQILRIDFLPLWKK